MHWFSFFNPGGKIKEALRKGAIIIDVRTAAEFDRGHIPDAMHIPVDRIHINTGRIKALNRPVILCCNSGHRSGQAFSVLKKEGIEAYNAGNWERLLKTINKL
jgi:rhodanese-related sulfurtransferase